MFLISLDWLYSNTQQDYNSREKQQFFQSYIHSWIDLSLVSSWCLEDSSAQMEE